MKNVRVMVNCALLTAFSLILELFFAFPLIPSMPFLLYAPGDLPILFITYFYGWVPGLFAVAINATLFILIRPPDAFPLYGLVMHFIASTSFISVFYLFGRRRKFHAIIVGLALGTLARALVMIPSNLYLTPFYMKALIPNETIEVHRNTVKNWIIPGIIPFNLLHSGINSVLFVLLKLALGKSFEEYMLKNNKE